MSVMASDAPQMERHDDSAKCSEGRCYEDTALQSGEAGKLPRLFSQHAAGQSLATEVACEQWFATGWLLSVLTGHYRLLGN